MKSIEEQFSTLLSTNKKVQKTISNALGIKNPKQYVEKINADNTIDLKTSNKQNKQLEEFARILAFNIRLLAVGTYRSRSMEKGAPLRYKRRNSLGNGLKIRRDSNNEYCIYYDEKTAWGKSVYSSVVKSYPQYETGAENKGYIPLLMNDGFTVYHHNRYRDPKYPNESLYELKGHRRMGSWRGSHFMENAIKKVVADYSKSYPEKIGITIKLVKTYNGTPLKNDCPFIEI